MRKNLLLLFILFFFIGFKCFAQPTFIKGNVIDAKSKEPLAYVSIVVKSENIGTNSDQIGNFTLNFNSNSDTIIVSYLGYLTKRVKIEPHQRQAINIALEATAVAGNEVVITGKKREKFKDTTAIRIYRNVLANKDKNRPRAYDSYQYEEYAKYIVDVLNLNEKLQDSKLAKPFEYMLINQDTTADGRIFIPVMIKEAVNDVYHTENPKRDKTIIKAERISGLNNQSYSNVANSQFIDIDVYENVIIMFRTSFLSPFSNTGLVNYNYYFEDSTLVNGDWIYKISFTGRSRESFAFVGYAWVHAPTYAITRVQMQLNEKSNINFLTDFAIDQTFEYIPDVGWFKSKETQLNGLGVSKKDDKMSVRIKKSISRKNIKLNKTIADNVFTGDPIEFFNAEKINDENLWKNLRQDTLTKVEQMIYNTVDSVKNTRGFKTYEWLTYFGTTQYFRLGSVEIGKFYRLFSYNAIEGYRLRLGGRTNVSFSEKVQLQGFLAYGLTDQKWKYGASFATNLKRNNMHWNLLGLEYLNDYVRFGPEELLLYHDNLVLSIMSNQPINDIIKKEQFRVYFQHEWRRGLQSNFSFLYQTHLPLAGLYDFKVSNNNGTFRNINQFETSKFTIQTRYGPEEPFIDRNFNRSYMQSYRPVFILNYSLAVKDFFGSDYSYQDISFEYKYFKNSSLGYTRYKLMGGKIIGSVPYTLLKFMPGNNTYMLDGNRYALMNEFEFASDQYAAIWIEHHFDGVFSNRVPLLKKTRLRSLVYTKTMYGTISTQNRNMMVFPDGLYSTDGLYAEAGIGFENIFKFIRIDFIRRFTQTNLPNSRPYGFQLSFVPKF